MDHDEDAKKQVEAFLRVVHDRYGISESDVFRFIEYNKKLIEGGGSGFSVGVVAGKAAVVFLVGAFFSGVGWAVLHFIHAVANRGGTVP